MSHEQREMKADNQSNVPHKMLILLDPGKFGEKNSCKTIRGTWKPVT